MVDRNPRDLKPAGADSNFTLSATPTTPGSSLLSCPLCGLGVPAGTRFCPNDSTAIASESARAVTNYEFIRLIGSGGMGDVYEAEHVVLKKRVAIKTLKSHLMETNAFMRFQTEAQAASRLQHPNIIAVHDCGISLSGEPYMIMELVQGSTLAHCIESCGSLSIEESIDIIIQICKGVMCAHEAGILHRDLKPSNIILEEKNNSKHFVARVLDFGIAKILDSTESSAHLTRTGEFFGTPSYMSPEQCNGQIVDQRSDIYSLGCILYEMLTGDPPIIGKSAMETMLKQTTNKPLPLKQAAMRSFPEPLEKIVARALEKDPANRYANMSDMLASIQNFRDGVAERNTTTVQLPKKKITAVHIALVASVVTAIGVLWLCLSLGGDNANSGVLSGDDIRKTHNEVAEASPPQAPQPVITQHKTDDDNPLLRADMKKYFGQQAMKEVVTPPPECESVIDQDLQLLTSAVTPTRVVLRGCLKLSNKGLKIIDTMPHVHTLDLSDCTFANDSLPLLAKMPLKELTLSRNPITNQGLTAFDAHCMVQNLYLKEIAGIGGDGLKPLSRLPNLKCLILDNCPHVNDKSIAALATSKLESILLNRTSVTDKCVPILASMPAVRRIVLTGTEVSGKSLLELTKLKSLKELELALCARVSSADVAEFKKLRSDVRIVYP